MPNQSKAVIITSGILYAFYRLVDLKIRRDQYQENKKKRKSKTYVFSWSSGSAHHGFQRYESDYAVGHMAIQFDDQYVSFWPKGSNKPGINPLHLVTNDGQLSTISRDIQIEKKLPDTILVINGLDHTLMLAALQQLQEDIRDKKIKFQVIHNTPWQDPDTNNKHHCATITNKLLSAGGFPVKRRVLAPWSITPGTLHYFYRGIGAQEISRADKKEKLINELKAKTRYKPL